MVHRQNKTSFRVVSAFAEQALYHQLYVCAFGGQSTVTSKQPHQVHHSFSDARSRGKSAVSQLPIVPAGVVVRHALAGLAMSMLSQLALATPAPPDRRASDRAAGVMSFDDIDGYQPPSLRILWLENTLDCRTWSYYCDIHDAMAKYHKLCTPIRSLSCLDGFDPNLVVVGPRYTANLAQADETLGFDRLKYAHLPLVVMQNKMYEATTRELVGTPTLKLKWVQDTGAIAAFTWLTQHQQFTRQSGVPHHWMPFGVDHQLYGRYAGQVGPLVQPYDIGFTGASSKKYPLRQAILATLRGMSNISSYLGTWAQTALNVKHNDSWKAPTRDGYVRQLSKAKMWVSTLGPSNIVGTRYFEVLGSGTTMLLCNRPPAGEWVYDGLFEDGKHVVMFDSVADMRDKVNYYLLHEEERQRIVRDAHALVLSRHTWDARARFVSKVALAAMARHAAGTAFYRAPPGAAALTQDARYEGCYPRLPEFGDLRVRRPLRRFTVPSCLKACGKAPLFALHCGGFCTGNGHRLGQCLCGRREIAEKGKRKQLPDRDCATTCSLHDSRPCGGYHGIAVYRPSQPSANRTEVDAPLMRVGRRGKGRKAKGRGTVNQKVRPLRVLRGIPQRPLRDGSRSSGGEGTPPRGECLKSEDGCLNEKILRIVPKDCGAGFFALVLYALNQLIWADENGYIAHVLFGPTCPDGRPNRYFDKTRGPNMWTYYFRPVWENVRNDRPKDLQLSNKELFNLHHMSTSSIQTYPHGVHRHLKVPKWRYDEAWHYEMRIKAHRVMAKYVRIRQKVLEVAQDFYQRQIVARGARPLLGLHIRGTDKIRNVGGRIVPPEEYLPVATAFLRRHPDALIYVATDSPSFLQQMRAEHGQRLVVYEALRSDRNAFADSSLADNYKKGEDALVESLLLSCTNFLVKPASALSEFALYFNPALHNHTIEMQYDVGRPSEADVLAAHFASARDGLRGTARCPHVFPSVAGVAPWEPR